MTIRDWWEADWTWPTTFVFMGYGLVVGALDLGWPLTLMCLVGAWLAAPIDSRTQTNSKGLGKR